MWPLVVTYIHSICFEYVYPSGKYGTYNHSYIAMTLIPSLVWKYHPRDRCLFSSAIRPVSWVLGFLKSTSVYIVS